MGSRRISPEHRVKDGKVLVIARGPRFRRLLDEAFDQIRHSAKGNLAVLLRMLRGLRTIAVQTYARKRALREHGELVAALAHRAAGSPRDAENVSAAVDTLSRVLGAIPAGRSASVHLAQP